MKLLVYGSKGWIGTQFMKIASNHTIAGKSRLDDIAAVKKELDEVAPTHVFCFIGRTHGTLGEKVYTTRKTGR
jgi:hypothetical protein